jgi:hypothetical protein
MSTFVCSVRKRHPKVIYDVTAYISFRHGSVYGRHPVPQGCVRIHPCNLGPGSPCRDDESCNVYVTHTNLMASPQPKLKF